MILNRAYKEDIFEVLQSYKKIFRLDVTVKSFPYENLQNKYFIKAYQRPERSTVIWEAILSSRNQIFSLFVCIFSL